MIDGQTRIADVYAENKFNLFLKYCEENGLKVMDDLKGYDFANLQGVDHIGVGKINDIRSRCKAFFGEEALTSFSESCDIEAFHEINEDIADCDIDFLCTFDIKKRAVQSLRKNGCRTVGDLKDVSKATLKKLLTVGSYKNLIAAEEYLSKPLGQLLESRLQGLSEEPGYMITVLRAEGYTLQAIGDSYHVTRERIRQIVNKFEKRIEPIMSAFTTMNLRKKGYISGSDIIDYYEDEKKNSPFC